MILHTLVSVLPKLWVLAVILHTLSLSHSHSHTECCSSPVAVQQQLGHNLQFLFVFKRFFHCCATPISDKTFNMMKEVTLQKKKKKKTSCTAALGEPTLVINQGRVDSTAPCLASSYLIPPPSSSLLVFLPIHCPLLIFHTGTLPATRV